MEKKITQATSERAAFGFLQPRSLLEPAAPCDMVGRDREIELLRRFLTGAPSGRPLCVVVVGEPGSGKTSVIDCALAGLPHPVTRLDPDQTVDRLRQPLSAGPAVIVVDDADRLRPDALDALLTRLCRQPAFLIPTVFALRPDSPAAEGLTALPTVVLAPLDTESARALLARHATGPVAARVADRLIAATGANPEALRHLASNLSADELAGQRPLPHPPDIGPRLISSFAGTVAAMDEPSRLAVLSAAAEGSSSGARAGAAGVVGAARAADDTVAPPLLLSAVYHSATSEERRRAHAALAAGCREAGDAESEAWHLLRSVEAPDPETADRVMAGAELAGSRHRLVEAADLYAGVARLTPGASQRTDAMLGAVTAWLAVGRTTTAEKTAEALLGAALAPPARSRAGWLRGRTLLVSGQELEGRRYLSELAEATAGTSPQWAARMAAAVSASALRSGRFGEAAGSAEAALRWSELADEMAREMARLVADAVRLAGGDRRGAGSLVAGLEEACRSEQLLLEDPLVAVSAPLAMIWSENHDAADRVLSRFEGAAREANAYAALGAVLTTTALLRHRTCDPSAAAAAGEEAWQLAILTAQPTVATISTAVLAVAEAILGRAERCRIRCARLLEQASTAPAIRASALAALGLLELGEDRPAQAIRWLEVLAATPESAARSDPGFMLWRADLIDAYRGAGQTDRAWAVLNDLERSSVSGTGKSRASAAVKRCRAALCDDEQAEGLYREAIQLYEGPAWRFARARTLLSLGDHLHRRGDRPGAETALLEARSLFREIAAPGWERQALGLLDQLGFHAERPTVAPSLSLSPAEHQVAMAASLGGTTADISAALAMPEPQVAVHLTSALDKLGVTAGKLGELAAELASRSPAPLVTQPRRPGSGSDDAITVPSGRIRLLGEFEIDVAGTRDTCPGGSVGLAVKIVALAGRLPADELICELWPEADTDTGRNRLRTLLSRLRQRCGPILTRTGDRIALAPGIETDARRFEAATLAAMAARAADDRRWGQLAREALDLYRGELLPGDREVARAVGLRERLRRRHLEVLYLVAQDCSSEGDVDEAVALLEDAIAANRHDEGPYVRAASVLEEAGRAVEALGVLRRARAALAEIGLSLSPAGESIERSLLSGQ